MLYAFAVGEVPISICGDPADPEPLLHTVRAVGSVTEAICALGPGDQLGVRGPYGSSWPVDEAGAGDLVIVAGGLGLAPLRPALLAAMARRDDFRRVLLLYGGREPEQLLYRGELGRWASEPELELGLTVDSASGDWSGDVGVVTKLIDRAEFDPEQAIGLRVRAGGDDALRGAGAARSRRRRGAHPRLDRAQHEMRHHPLRALRVRPNLRMQGGTGDAPLRHRALLPSTGGVMAEPRPKLAVWKFASCDGCQLSLLDCEDELLTLADQIDVAHFLEARRATVEGPYDLSLVEGSITTAEDAERIQQVRRASRRLVTIGACATAGGIQALRNFADSQEFVSAVYATPEYISTLETSTPISAHVPVDFELQGCPINKHQLLEVIGAFLGERRPNIPTYSVCMECKRRENVCVMVAHGTPCLGPVTHAGCGALCPSYNRGCYGCYGPMESPNTAVTGRLDARQPRLWGARPGPLFPQLLRGQTGLPQRERGARAEGRQWPIAATGRRGRSAPRPLPGWRARARCTCGSAATKCWTWSCGSTSPRACSRPCCAAAPSPTPPTSRRGSAGSARSPTR